MQAHERRDIPVKLIGQFLLALLIGGVLVVGAVGLLWWVFGSNQPQAVVSPWSGPRELPPGPRLQVDPKTELRTYLESEQKRLSTYGWVDQSAGVAHIPIERAMDLLLERGVPTRQSPAQAAAAQPAPAKPGQPSQQQRPAPAKPVERSKPVAPANR